MRLFCLSVFFLAELSDFKNRDFQCSSTAFMSVKPNAFTLESETTRVIPNVSDSRKMKPMQHSLMSEITREIMNVSDYCTKFSPIMKQMFSLLFCSSQVKAANQMILNFFRNNKLIKSNTCAFFLHWLPMLGHAHIWVVCDVVMCTDSQYRSEIYSVSVNIRSIPRTAE